MSDRIDRIVELDDSDHRLWWLRWVDRYEVRGRTGSPTVEACFSLLPLTLEGLNEGLQSLDVVATTTQSKVVSVAVGAIPRLRLGAIFQDGIQVGDLDLEHRVFEFDFRDTPPQMLRAGAILASAPSWWDHAYPYRVLGYAEYPLGKYLDSWCVVLRHGNITLVLPSHEVFRALLAPHSDLALALTSAPWSQSRDRIANPRYTKRRPDGTWQILLRRRLPERIIPTVANLLLSPVGIAAANGIFSSFLASKGPGQIYAPIPFDVEHLRLGVRCLPLARDGSKYLGMEIREISWPLRRIAIHHESDLSNQRGRKQHVEPGPPPPGAHASDAFRDDPEDDDPVPIDSGDDPGRRRRILEFPCRSPAWIDGPSLRRLEKQESGTYLGIRNGQPPTATYRASPGTPAGSGALGRAVYASVEPRPVCERLLLVACTLNTLKDDGRIDGWTPLPRPRPGASIPVGNLPAWPLPKRLVDGNGHYRLHPWSLLDLARGHRRAALVFEIHVGGREIYWIEVEVRLQIESLKSLIFRTEGDPVLNVSELLEHCVRQRGVWGDAQHLLWRRGIRDVATFWHPKRVAHDTVATASTRFAERAYIQILHIAGLLGT